MTIREHVARELYRASGGDEAVFPWPCKGAARYRHLADAAIAALRDTPRPDVPWDTSGISPCLDAPQEHTR